MLSTTTSVTHPAGADPRINDSDSRVRTNRHDTEQQQASLKWQPSPEDSLPRYLTVAEFAKRISATQDTLRTWAASGKLPHVKFGKSIRIPITVLENGF